MTTKASAHEGRAGVYVTVTGRILGLLRRGTIPWRQPWQRIPPQNLASRRAYRGINPFLLASAGYASPYWLTYRQAKHLGGHVRRGEHGTMIVFWKVYEHERLTEDGEPETARIPVLRTYHVFNLEQCAAISDNHIPHQAPTFEPLAAAEGVVRHMPAPPLIRHDTMKPFYRPATDTIHLPSRAAFDRAESYYATLFHELAHSTGHTTRLDRCLDRGLTTLDLPAYSYEELVAEMGAAFLCGHTGITPATIENNAAYINGWLQRLDNDHKLVAIAAAQAQQAADYILKAGHDTAGAAK